MSQSQAPAFVDLAQCKQAMSLLADAFIQHFQGLNSGFARNSSKLWISPRWTPYPALGYPSTFDGQTAVFSEAFRIAHNPDDVPNGYIRENRTKALKIAVDRISDHYRVSSNSVVEIPPFTCTPEQAMDFIKAWRPKLPNNPDATYENMESMDVKYSLFSTPFNAEQNYEETGWMNPAFDELVESGRVVKLLQVPFVFDELDICDRFYVHNSILHFCTFGNKHYPVEDVTVEQISFLRTHQRTLKIIFLAQQAKTKIMPGDILPVRNVCRLSFAFMKPSDLPPFVEPVANFYTAGGTISKFVPFLEQL